VTVSNEWYAIRDCHEMNQHNFKPKIELIDYLNLTYQFSNEIKLNGCDLSNYSNVEFLIIDKQFGSCFDLTPDFNSSKNQYVDVQKRIIMIKIIMIIILKIITKIIILFNFIYVTIYLIV